MGDFFCKVELMKYVKTAVLFNMFLLIVVPASLSIASTSLSLYEATFEVIANQKNEFRDVQVELKITYHINNKLKTVDIISAVFFAISGFTSKP